jgi:hypothetical protein
MPTCPMNLLDSTLLHSVGYDPQKKSLLIKFLKGGLYRYNGVPHEVYEELLYGSSAGKFFLTRIKNQYPTTKEE